MSLPSHTEFFRHDTRDELWIWVAENLPPDAKFLYEQWTGIRPWEARCVANAMPALPNAGTVQGQIDAGYTHAAFTSMAFGPYFDKWETPTKAFELEYARRKLMYEALRTGGAGEIVFERHPRRAAPEMHSPQV